MRKSCRINPGREIDFYNGQTRENYDDLDESVSMENKKKIQALIIDDETDICYLLSNILECRNVSSQIAGSLGEAEHLLHKQPVPEIIFLDNNLPDGAGMQYIHVLKDRYPDSKVVMITAYDTISDRENARKEGADCFLGKPFSKEMIYNLMGKFFPNHVQRD
jgi:two-component system, OmpR family, response regulator